MNRSILQLSRGMGSLGIRNVNCFNSAMLMKQVWRMHTNPQLLVSKIYNSRGPSALGSDVSNVVLGKRFS